MTQAERAALRRARERRGERVYRVTLGTRTIEQLVDLGRLTDEESDDPARVGLELAALVEERVSLLRQLR